jgi:hypothetical protein
VELYLHSPIRLDSVVLSKCRVRIPSGDLGSAAVLKDYRRIRRLLKTITRYTMQLEIVLELK